MDAVGQEVLHSGFFEEVVDRTGLSERVSKRVREAALLVGTVFCSVFVPQRRGAYRAGLSGSPPRPSAHCAARRLRPEAQAGGGAAPKSSSGGA